MARKTTTRQDSTNSNSHQATEQATVVESTELTASSTVSDCGGALKQAREKLNLTVHDISSSLRLSDKQIDAMEADQFQLLPQPSIVRGFIRNYAKIVKINADPIIAAYNARVPDGAPQSFTVKSNTTRSVIGEQKTSFSPTVFAGLMLLFAVMIGGFYYYTQYIKPNTAKPETTPITSSEELNVDVTANSASSEFALPSADRQPENLNNDSVQHGIVAENTSTTDIALPSSTLANNTVANNTVPTAGANNAAPATEITPPATTALANPQLQADTAMTSNLANHSVDNNNQNNATSESANSLTAGTLKTGTLEIRATDETWVNIVNSRGKQIYSKVLVAGQSDSVTANPPLKVTVGNAQHTSLNFNGQAVDLAAHTRDKVARLTISE